MSKFIKVALHSELQHVVLNSASVVRDSLERPALCGKSPWPERWNQVEEGGMFCVDCLRQARKT